MALIKCPECGKEISDKAASCPNCGFPISETKAPQKEREVELMGRMKARTEDENIEIYLDGNLLFRAQFRDFTLLYNKEVTDELGSTQLKVAFSSPRQTIQDLRENQFSKIQECQGFCQRGC